MTTKEELETQVRSLESKLSEKRETVYMADLEWAYEVVKAQGPMPVQEFYRIALVERGLKPKVASIGGYQPRDAKHTAHALLVDLAEAGLVSENVERTLKA